MGTPQQVFWGINIVVIYHTRRYKMGVLEAVMKQRELEQQASQFQAQQTMSLLDSLMQQAERRKANELLSGELALKQQQQNILLQKQSMLNQFLQGGNAGQNGDWQVNEIDSEGNVKIKKREIPQDKAGLYTLAKESIGGVQDIIDTLFPDGTPQSFKRDVALKSKLPFLGRPMPNDPEGQKVYNRMTTALAGRQLIQTGVAARPDETKSLYNAFMADVTSNPETALGNLKRLQDFYKNYSSVLETKNPDSVNYETKSSSEVTGGLPDWVTKHPKKEVEIFYKRAKAAGYTDDKVIQSELKKRGLF